jgi:hypothetical protein
MDGIARSTTSRLFALSASCNGELDCFEPYKVALSLGDRKRIKAGKIFVKHGSQVEEPNLMSSMHLLKKPKAHRGKPMALIDCRTEEDLVPSKDLFFMCISDN